MTEFRGAFEPKKLPPRTVRAEENMSEDFDEKAMRFYDETGIWPPGKDAPAALNIVDDEYRLRIMAFDYWKKAAEQNKRLREALEQYGTHWDSCALNLIGGSECSCGFEQALKEQQ